MSDLLVELVVQASFQGITAPSIGMAGLLKNICCGVQFKIFAYSSASVRDMPMSPFLCRDNVGGWMPFNSATMLLLRPDLTIILCRLFGATMFSAVFVTTINTFSV